MGFQTTAVRLLKAGWQLRGDLGMMPRPLAEQVRDALLDRYEVKLIDSGQRGQMPGAHFYLFTKKKRNDAD